MSEMERDPVLAAALRDLHGEPPPMDFDALRARITARAELPLAQRRRGRTLARGLRAVLPLAAAAGIAAVALALREPTPLSASEQAVVEEILDLSLPGELMTGEAADQALLEAVEE